jgi:hypothetical protein
MSMWRELLKVIPQVDSAGLNDMENKLSKRFAGVAKKFGVGLKRAIMGGGLTALAVGIIDKILNPLQETQAALDRILGQTDDVVTAAKQFETTSGKYFKLQQLALSTGLDEGTLQLLLTKFQTALAEERAKKPGEQKGTLKEFVGINDTVEAFYQFAQSLQNLEKTNKDDSILIQKQIFGEKAIGKMASFFQLDMPKRLQEMDAGKTEDYTKAFDKLAPLEEMSKTLTGKMNLQDVITKGNTIQPEFIQANAKLEQQRLDQENKRLASYQSMEKAAIASEAMKQKLEQIFLNLSQYTPQALGVVQKIENGVGEVKGFLKDVGENVRDVQKSRMLKGYKGTGRNLNY